MNFRVELLQFRAKNNLTQKQVAEIFGVHINSIAKYEMGCTTPRTTNKIKFENKMKEWEENKNESL